MSNGILDEDTQDEAVQSALEEEFNIASQAAGDLGEPAQVYPVTDDKHVGVSTNAGTPPSATDDVDEADLLAGTPDDVGDGGTEGDKKGLDDSVVMQ